MNKVGDKKLNNQKIMMEIIKYKNVKNIDVIFEDGTIIYNRQVSDFLRGEIKNYNFPSKYGVGYLGEEYLKDGAIRDEKSYLTWQHMLSRCYDIKNKSYKFYSDCTVCKEWHNYTNFKIWYDNNFYTIDNQIINLDKDILCKGNKIYSPETCIFVPQEINKLFTKRHNFRGEYPIGISKITNSDKLQVSCNFGKGTSVYLGSFLTVEDAFECYKLNKEKYIKQLANKYRANIPKKLFEALCNYIVEITD